MWGIAATSMAPCRVSEKPKDRKTKEPPDEYKEYPHEKQIRRNQG